MFTCLLLLFTEVLPREVVVNELQPLRLEDLTGMSCNDDSGHSETGLLLFTY